MTSRLVVNSVRHTGASADAITLDASWKMLPSLQMLHAQEQLQVLEEVKFFKYNRQ